MWKNFMDLCQRIENLIAPVMANDGYGLVRVQLSGSMRKTLQIMIERLDDAGVGIQDCENVSKLISPILDMDDVISEHYVLEVSSPGLDRPLTKPQDFIKYQGQPVVIQTNHAIKNRKKFQGTLEFASETGIKLILDHPNDDQSLDVEMTYDDVRSARLNPDI
jgi:ribosome maturation factor RimP